MPADLVLHNAKIATHSVPSFVEAIAIKEGKISLAGTNDEILRLGGPTTKVIDGKGHTVIPGLNDSHMHPIRGGLNYNLELRWDGVPSLADALRRLKDQAARTPPASWGNSRTLGPWRHWSGPLPPTVRRQSKRPSKPSRNLGLPPFPLWLPFCRTRWKGPGKERQ
jgi:predicted amidohydrolase YtcJ